MSLKISAGLSLPLEAATWVISYLAKRGAGKTYCASVQAEEMLKARIPIVVIDGMGIWWGLRVSADGLHEGLPGLSCANCGSILRLPTNLKSVMEIGNL